MFHTRGYNGRGGELFLIAVSDNVLQHLRKMQSHLRQYRNAIWRLSSEPYPMPRENLPLSGGTYFQVVSLWGYCADASPNCRYTARRGG